MLANIKTSWLLAVVAIAAAGCQDYSFMFRPNQRVVITTLREMVIIPTDTDVLFVIDNSGSMGEEQNNLIRNTALFIDILADSENSYRVGVITTNALDEDPTDKIPDALGTDGGRLRMQRASSGQLNAAGCNIGPDTSGLNYLVRPPLTAPDLDAQRCRLVEDFRETVRSLGTGGSSRESGLLAAWRALNPNPAVETHNGEFLREESALALIFVTDEDDCSFDNYGIDDSWNNPACYQLLDQATSANDYVERFASLKSRGGVRKIRSALIAGGSYAGQDAEDFEPSGCRISSGNLTVNCGCWSSTDEDFFCEYLHTNFNHVCPSVTGCSIPGGPIGDSCDSVGSGTCDTRRCEALPGKRYHDFILKLSGARVDVGFPRGTFEDSICQPEYDKTLEKIALSVVLDDCFALEDAIADPEQVRMILRATDDDGNVVEEREVQRFDPASPPAGCPVCNETCAAPGAWNMEDEHR
ncbi:vWA domain-containing protein, partial [Myxococcota bacterium]